MYAEIILDYYHNPPNKGIIPNSDFKARDVNPLCGDVVEIYLNFGPEEQDQNTLDNMDTRRIITKASFNGCGCAISQAAASMLAEHLVGKTLEQARSISKEEVLSLLGVPISYARLKCALLAWAVVRGYKIEI